MVLTPTTIGLLFLQHHQLSLRASGSRESAPDDRLSEAIQKYDGKAGLLRRFAPLRKRFAFVAGNDGERRW